MFVVNLGEGREYYLEVIWMDFAYYSLGLVIAYAVVRWFTENIKFHIRNDVLWVHHWIIAFVSMLPLLYFEVQHPFIWGAITGVALEGLGRKNWSIRRK